MFGFMLGIYIEKIIEGFENFRKEYDRMGLGRFFYDVVVLFSNKIDYK